MVKEFISVCLNQAKGTYDIVWNAYFKCLNARVYTVDDDYDFGAIDPADLAVEMYQQNLSTLPGIQLKVSI